MDENNNDLNLGEANSSEESNIAADNSIEQENTGYTGEYGNSVEGDYQDHNQSVYRYSYKDGNGESTHSGDYYEGKNEQGNSGDAVSRENTQGNGQPAGQGYQNGGYQGGGYQSGGYQNNGYPNNAYQNSGYQNNAYQNNAYQNQGNMPPKKEKGQASFGKKVLIAAVATVFFTVLS